MKKLCFFKTRLLVGLLLITSIAFAQDFKTRWENTTSGGFTIEIPINPDANLTYDYSVDFGDGTILNNQSNTVSHTFSSEGPHDVKISGTYPAIFMKASSSKDYLVKILDWGGPSFPWQTMTFAFSGCTKLLSAQTDPNLSSVTDLSYMFQNAKSFNSFFGNWDVSTITNMQGMFSGAESYNAHIRNWNVSSVTNMSHMFENAKTYNKTMREWITSNVVDMSYMFSGASSYNAASDLGLWDVEDVINFEGMFQNASSFNNPNVNNWNVSNGANFSNMFSNCVSFNQPLDAWSTASAEDMSNMFEGASSFDQELGDWNVSSVLNMDDMLSATNLSECNYEMTLDSWGNSSLSGVNLGADGLGYFNTATRSLFTANNSVDGDIQNAIGQCPTNSMECGVGLSTFFVLEFDLSLPNDPIDPNVQPQFDRIIEIPTVIGSKYDIDWNNDGSFSDPEDIIGALGTQQYNYPGTNDIVQVAIRENAVDGSFPTVSFGSSEYRTKLISIEQWGCINWGTLHRSFLGCSNLMYNATDVPDLSNVTDLSYIFSGCTAITDPNLNDWDVSNVENMSFMFSDAFNFNGNIIDWNTTSCTDMQGMFNEAARFNQDINFNSSNNAWDVSNVQTFAFMFSGATRFNGDISNWETISCTNLEGMFANTDDFNQSLATTNNTWNISNVTSLRATFFNAESFNQDLGSWNTSNVINLNNTFSGATEFDNGQVITDPLFDHPLNWNVSSCNTMVGTFRDCNFNQNISNWNTSNVTSMASMFESNSVFQQNINRVTATNNWNVNNVVDFSNMFQGSIFNQDIRDWNINTTNLVGVNMNGMFKYSSFNQPINIWVVSNVRSMSGMFQSSVFSQLLNLWNVSSVTDMSKMFESATDFSQNIGMWPLNSVTNMLEMLNSNSGGMSQIDYENTLIGWAGPATSPNTNTPNNLTLGAAGRNYCNDLGRDALIAMGWDFTNTGDINVCPPSISGGNQSPKSKLESIQIENGSNSFRIKFSENELESKILKGVQLLNMNGQLIYESKSSELSHSTENISDGIYLLKIETNQGFETKKINISN